MDLSNVYCLHQIGGKKNQEDYIWPEEGTATLNDKVFIVCDGVGGSENGEIASRIISESMGKALSASAQGDISVDYINHLLSEAKQTLVNYAGANGLSSDMATTFTALILFKKKAFVTWCGDSRIYHLRKGEVLYRSSDHSLVNSLVKNGEITEEEAMSHPQKNIILKAIKADSSTIEADGDWIVDLQGGDYFLLCTDGLLENITNKDLKFLLNQNDQGNIDLVQSFQQFCLNKTRDNYSMYLIKLKEEINPKKYRLKIYFLASLLVLLVASSVVLVRDYFKEKDRATSAVPVKVITDTATATPEQPDTISYREVANGGLDTLSSIQATAALPAIPPFDSVPSRKPVSKKNKDTSIITDISKTYDTSTKSSTPFNSKTNKAQPVKKINIDSILNAPDTGSNNRR